MNGEDRILRDEKIVRLHLAGSRPADIAKAVGLTADRVRTILKDRGFTLHEGPERKAGFWDRGGDLRGAIARRARDGARAALEAMEAGR